MINFLLFILVLPLLPHVEIMSNITSQMILFKDFLCRNFGQASFFLIAVSSPVPTFLKVVSIVISKLKPQMQSFHLNLESWYQKVIIRSVLVEIFMCLWTSRGQGLKCNCWEWGFVLRMGINPVCTTLKKKQPYLTSLRY